MKLNDLKYKLSYFYTLVLTCVFFFIALAMISFPAETIAGASTGLRIFALILLPALFPFLILSEILMGLGVVHFLGTLLEPLMKPLFKIPGMGAFAIAMSLSSGYLTGAIITAKLRKEKMCTQIEAERLLAITNVANPLFVMGSVAVGMFQSPELGITLAVAHYLACLSVGLVFRFYGSNEHQEEFNCTPKRNILIRAFQEMYQTRLADGRPLGQLLGESVQHSVSNMFLVGGFIVLFSVIINLLTAMGIAQLLCIALGKILVILGLSTGLSPALVNGFLEVTLGSTLASQAAAPVWQKIIVASSIIAWSGLSVQAQVISIISRTDIRILPYLTARILHTIFASLLAFILIKPNHLLSNNFVLPALSSLGSKQAISSFSFSLASLGVVLIIFLVLAMIFSFIRRLKIIIYRIK